jgi:hypothetical protein
VFLIWGTFFSIEVRCTSFPLLVEEESSKSTLVQRTQQNYTKLNQMIISAAFCDAVIRKLYVVRTILEESFMNKREKERKAYLPRRDLYFSLVKQGKYVHSLSDWLNFFADYVYDLKTIKMRLDRYGKMWNEYRATILRLASVLKVDIRPGIDLYYNTVSAFLNENKAIFEKEKSEL